MQKTSLWQRLHSAFFPPVALPPPPPPALTPWKQPEEEFFQYLNDRNFKTSTDDTVKGRVVMYYDGDTGELFAIAVRWPNRYYYYTIES